MQIISVTGGSLFALAAAQLGDATQWIRIAQLNNLDDPMLTGVTTVFIPVKQQTSTGGIAKQ